MTHPVCVAHGMPSDQTCQRCGSFFCGACRDPSFPTLCFACAQRDSPQRVKGRNLAQELAKASWVAPLLLVLVLNGGKQALSPLLLGLVMLGGLLVGLGSGVAALVLMKRHGAEGVRRGAITGLVINGGLLTLFVFGAVSGFLHHRSERRAAHGVARH